MDLAHPRMNSDTGVCFCHIWELRLYRRRNNIAPDKDWRQMGIYPPLFGLIGYFKF